MRFGIDKEYGLAMIAIMCYVYDVTLWWPVNCIAPKSRHETCHWKMLLGNAILCNMKFLIII